ncbi:hypothetical protein MMC34_008160 [Xylographa carneopallida]|nr:hypothetical protein [Xylographa carneopallida]
MVSPLADHTGWQITPTLHSRAEGSIDPRNYSLQPSFSVCVLGASRGIGAAIAYAFVRAGAGYLILTGRDLPALENVAKEAQQLATNKSLKVITAYCEVTSDANVATIAKLIREKAGRLDVAIFNAGLWGSTDIRITEGSTQQFQDVVNTDIMGTYLAAHQLVPLLLSSEGGARSFVAISGTGAWVVDGPVAHAAHCTGKLAQARLIEHMANNFRQEGLLAVAVHPGCTPTDTSLSAPEIFHPYLTDDIGLCGGFLVWLTSRASDRLWLSGRFISATWDIEELESMKDSIVSADMLKARMVVS